jgi:hypothetical protein
MAQEQGRYIGRPRDISSSIGGQWFLMGWETLAQSVLDNKQNDPSLCILFKTVAFNWA